MTLSRLPYLLLPLICLLYLGADAPDGRVADKEALAPLQEYVGSWRGVGQIRRGSNQGAWIEQSEWSWKFTKDEALLNFASTKAKHLGAGELRATDEPGRYQLIATAADGERQITYSGSVDQDANLVLVAEKPQSDEPARITIRLVAEGKRLVVLYERQSDASGRYARLAEVGYTREGSNFGGGTSFVECVVTGGKGTIPVAYEGKTYYVCCTGCRDLFNEDPAAALAEYRDRKVAETADRK